MSLRVRDRVRYSWKRDTPDYRDYRFPVDASLFGSLPASVDLRPGFPPVYNQGRIGSCTGNAICGAFEYDLRKQGITDFMPSRLFVYYNERSMEGTTAFDAGAQIRDGVKVIATLGVVPESEWPYDDTPADPNGQFPPESRAGQKPPASAYADATHNEAVQYARVEQELHSLKAVLASGFPIVFGFTVFSSFESPEVAETGIAPLPQPGDQVMGGHAVVLAGYDDAKQTFLVRNSWSDSWGQSGYFTLPYAYVAHPQLASDFWTIRKVS